MTEADHNDGYVIVAGATYRSEATARAPIWSRVVTLGSVRRTRAVGGAGGEEGGQVLERPVRQSRGEEAQGDPPMIIGDARDDDTLLAAGIERAATLIAALSSDNDNLSLTLTARSLRSDLFIVARAADQRNERKFLRAGADRVVNPYQIGGSRMGAIAIQPHVAEFLDDVLDDEVHDVDIQEVVVGAGSPAGGAHLGTVAGGRESALVVAVRDAAGRYALNPRADTVLRPGDVLIALGSRAQIERLAATAEHRARLPFRSRPNSGG